MKIERINENQIRCTLSKNDLAKHAIKISELAYGSEKAKGLFRDMMRQAQAELGFQADDIPLMIEAIPYSEYIVLIITKVEDPEELDTKFSSFAPGIELQDSALDEMIQDANASDEVLDLFKKIQNSIVPKLINDLRDTSDLDEPDEEGEAAAEDLTRIFVFSTLAHVSRLARLIGRHYHGVNSLYKDESYNTYVLVVTPGDHPIEEYNRFCNMVSEYGNMHKSTAATQHFLEEHFVPIIKDNALETLASL